MRITHQLTKAGPINWHALASEQDFLYRNIADQQRQLLFVGSLLEPRTLVFTDLVAQDWYFGSVRYDPSFGSTELRSRHADPSGQPLQKWSIPRWVVEWNSEGTFLHAFSNDMDPAIAFCEQLFSREVPPAIPIKLEWVPQTTLERYLQQAGRLLQHIQLGNIYEVNYCIERIAEARDLDPFRSFAMLHQNLSAPFSAFHRSGPHFALCASPERFLRFKGDKVISQPMKGTRPRSADPIEDARLSMELFNDAKERSENIMALDVARHDLSRVAASGSVRVDELCTVSSHAHVHQMTSSVSARIRSGYSPLDVVQAAFPMASMTGAPKFRAMQLIDEMEDQQRGLFSGTLGFFAPDGTADLNVVIRTVFFNSVTGKASMITGSALTATCDIEKEWEECELKARSVINALL